MWNVNIGVCGAGQKGIEGLLARASRVGERVYQASFDMLCGCLVVLCLLLCS